MQGSSGEDTVSRLYSIEDRLRAIANIGLYHKDNPFVVEQYKKVLESSAEILSIIENRTIHDVVSIYKDNMAHMSPKNGAEAAVFRDEKILLIKRHDDGLWAVPGGLSDVGETLAGSAIRELKEETGLSGRIIKLLGIFDSRIWNSREISQVYSAIFEVSSENDMPRNTHEAMDWGFFGEGELPDMSPGHDKRVPMLFKLRDGRIDTPFYDK
ncbi:MAG: NUDIX hydrolase [Dehalococcoidales bacterium]|nr:NUDIX hydrolase [Dehalococcoidales bacterium]